jgi:1,4-alpha-glucan branching enzyme
MGERMVHLSHRFRDAHGLQRRALDQAAREVMLAQSSDWAFIMKTGTTVPYATKRTNEHVKRFTRIYDALTNEQPIDEAWLGEVQRRDNLFPEADYRIYAS